MLTRKLDVTDLGAIESAYVRPWRAMLDTRAHYYFEIQIKKPHRRKHDEMFS